MTLNRGRTSGGKVWSRLDLVEPRHVHSDDAVGVLAVDDVHELHAPLHFVGLVAAADMHRLARGSRRRPSAGRGTPHRHRSTPRRSGRHRARASIGCTTVHDSGKNVTDGRSRLNDSNTRSLMVPAAAPAGNRDFGADVEELVVARIGQPEHECGDALVRRDDGVALKRMRGAAWRTVRTQSR